MSDEQAGAPDFVKVEFMDGPHDNETDRYASAGGNPPNRIGRTVAATGETAWYFHAGGHSNRDDWTYTFKWDHTDPPLELPFTPNG
ncbi:hypothetical protein [Leifsonia sp. NCR5]|uniref:hypothetical protein n=1 Tax=Leifsonia sp. NCR5 TaxID=1978342 RepID=UPI00117B3B39|nr:hypothetical protein [Leifsonia sp. NCR5]